MYHFGESIVVFESITMKSRKLYVVILSFLYMKFPENGTEFQPVSHPVSYSSASLTIYLDNIWVF